jgi:hypothetical protein
VRDIESKRKREREREQERAREREHDREEEREQEREREKNPEPNRKALKKFRRHQRLASSVIRVFRLVATQTAATLGSALVSAAVTLGDSREQATKLKELEEAKGDEAVPGRIRQFERQADEAHTAAGDARAALQQIFQGVAAVRFRDVCPEVRATVISAVGEWIDADPATNLSDSMLKYVAWALSDREARVRGVALHALTSLYGSAEARPALRAFTERFEARFLQLVDDVDDAVAAQGVRLLALLVREGELDAAAARGSARLLTDASSAPARAAAAELVAGLITGEGEAAAAQVRASEEEGSGGGGGGGGRKQKKANATRTRRRGRQQHEEEEEDEGEGEDEDEEAAATAAAKAAAASSSYSPAALEAAARAQLARLLDVLAGLAQPGGGGNGGVGGQNASSSAAIPSPETVDVVVDALADRVPVLTNWRALCAALTEDEACEERGEAATTTAALVLSSALAAAAARVKSSSGGARSRAASSSAPSPLSEATAAVSAQLPTLLTRFANDPVRVGALASALCSVSLDALASGDDGARSLADLLRRVATLLARNADARAVRACARALARCASEGPGAAREAAKAVLDGANAKAEAEAAKTAAAVLKGGGGGGGGGASRGAGAGAGAGGGRSLLPPGVETAAEVAWMRLACLRLVGPPPALDKMGAADESAVALLSAAAGGGASSASSASAPGSTFSVPAALTAHAAATALAGALWRLHKVQEEAEIVLARAEAERKEKDEVEETAEEGGSDDGDDGDDDDDDGGTKKRRRSRSASKASKKPKAAAAHASGPSAAKLAAALRTRASALAADAKQLATALAAVVSGARDADARAAAASALGDLLLAFSPAKIEAASPARAGAVQATNALVNPLLVYCDGVLGESGGEGGGGAGGEGGGSGGEGGGGAGGEGGGSGGDEANHPPAATSSRPVAAALLLARLVAFGAVSPTSHATYVLLSHIAAPCRAAAEAAREGIRALKRSQAALAAAAGAAAEGGGGGADEGGDAMAAPVLTSTASLRPGALDAATWARAFGAAAGRGELQALVSLVASAPPGSAADVGPHAAEALWAAVSEAAADLPSRIPALASGLSGLTPRIPPQAAAELAVRVRATAERVAAARPARGASSSAAAAARASATAAERAAALHSLADALVVRGKTALAGAGGAAPRPALRKATGGAGGRAGAAGKRRISFVDHGDDGEEVGEEEDAEEEPQQRDSIEEEEEAEGAPSRQIDSTLPTDDQLPGDGAGGRAGAGGAGGAGAAAAPRGARRAPPPPPPQLEASALDDDEEDEEGEEIEDDAAAAPTAVQASLDEPVRAGRRRF